MSFKDLKLIDELQKALHNEGYTTPTPIQLQAIPHLLAGKDLIGIAQTGTGKTAAFVLPILQRMCLQRTPTQPRQPRVLVLAPTRELAAQIEQSFVAYGRFLHFRHVSIFGGVGQNPQVKSLQHGVDILIATPGRLLDLMNQHFVSLRNIDFFVMDEADRMLDMGFIHDIRRIIAALPHTRQSLFFSATMSPQINELARSFLRNPEHVAVTPQATTVEKIDQKIFFVDQGNKNALLVKLLSQEHLKCVLVFTRTKSRANKLAEFLNKKGIRTDAIHGNKSQNHRMKAMHDFKTGRIRILVATDIAARGIDIDNISHVINYDLPNEPESYVHRIGRTARAGTEGTAYSFCAADERNYLRDIERLTRIKIDIVEHQFHSQSAMHATGEAARPAPKQSWHGNRRSGNRHGGHGSTHHGSGFRRRR